MVNPTSALDIKIPKSHPQLSSKFSIYDDVNPEQAHSKPTVSRDDILINKLSSCRLENEELREPPPHDSSPATKPAEKSVLERIRSNLEVCLNNFERIRNGGAMMEACKSAMVAETKWVSRFVDYTSKYGLGFLLNDGRYDRFDSYVSLFLHKPY